MASVIGVGPWPAGEGKDGRSKSKLRRRGGRSEPSVNQLIESDVIPKMLMAHVGTTSSIAPGTGAITQEDLDAFAPLAVTLEAHELLAEVQALIGRGLSVERIFIDLLAPTARRLGDEWTADRLDFLDVTMALWRLQEVLREIAAGSPAPLRFGPKRSALFTPFPGDQHSFGAAMIDETFARGGWDTELLIEPSRGTVLRHLASRDYDLVGLTVSCDCHIAPLPMFVAAVRSVSRNPNVRILLGGRVLFDDPDLARRAGADGTAGSALDALALANRILATPLTAITA